MRYIYKLIDPITNQIRYIGQTDNLQRRYNDHISSSLKKESRHFNTHKSRWIRKLINNGYKPVMEIIEECIDLVESNERERYHITKLTNEGYKLTNSHIGDVSEFSTDTRRKMSDFRKGKTLTEIVGEDNAKKLTDLFISRTKKYFTNRPKNDPVKKKISKTLKEYFKDKNNHWAYGLKMSDEHNEKLRMAKLNNPKNVGNRKPKTEEQKEKIRNKIRGSKIFRSEILQYDLNMNLIKEWKSLREIQNSGLQFNRKSISECCKGNKEFYAGFIWKYKNYINI